MDTKVCLRYPYQLFGIPPYNAYVQDTNAAINERKNKTIEIQPCCKNFKTKNNSLFFFVSTKIFKKFKNEKQKVFFVFKNY